MKAAETAFLTFLQVTQQLTIPIYQRTYSWQKEECLQLWSDVLRAGTDPTLNSHFVGSVVYITHRAAELTGQVPERLVIDGQQRLTTLTLLLAALRDVLLAREAGNDVDEEQEQLSAAQIQSQCLQNQFAAPDKRAKLLLTQKDRETLLRIVKKQSLESLSPEAKSAPILNNYALFRTQIEGALGRGLTPEDIYRGVQKLIIVEVVLESGIDDPQLIFESLNSTGRDLSQADLIRNFVLMRQAPEVQERLYTEHWQPMEREFVHRERTDHLDYYPRWFDWFARDYLTMKTGQIPKIGEVYEAFKSYGRRADTPSIPDIVADLHRFARYYTRLALELRETDAELHATLRDIADLEISVGYPFFLRVADDLALGKIDRTGFLGALRLVESYVFRRAICGIPTNSLNKTFAGLYAEAKLADAPTSVEYVERVLGALAKLDSYRRFPRDDEFRREMESKDVYHTRTCDYLLRKLENFERNEKIALPDPKITIEHILPQTDNLRPQWQAMLGENWKKDHAEWCNRVGNLTLTGNNSSFSDRPFEEKMQLEVNGDKVGLAHSPFRLNAEVKVQTKWDAQAIRARGEALSLRACSVWKGPQGESTGQ